MISTNFTGEQKVHIQWLDEKFQFEASNIKYKHIAFLDSEDAIGADELVDKAEKLQGIVLTYKRGTIPNGVTGDCAESYIRGGREITLTDEAAKWLALNKSKG